MTKEGDVAEAPKVPKKRAKSFGRRRKRPGPKPSRAKSRIRSSENPARPCGKRSGFKSGRDKRERKEEDTRYKHKTLLEYEDRLTVGASTISGKGVFAHEKPLKGEMLCRYTGAKITEAQQDDEEAANPEKPVYYFQGRGTTIIDGSKGGTCASYLNHSCEPNCFTQHVKLYAKDYIVITANRDIEEGEELTYEYVDSSVERPKRVDRKVPCGCPSCIRKDTKDRKLIAV